MSDDLLRITSKSDNLTIRRGGFYEDDEPVEKLEAAFEAGEKVITDATIKDLENE